MRSSSPTTEAPMPTEIALQMLRERRRSLLWWGVGISALVALNVAFYPSIRDSSALAGYAKDLPETLRALFAGGELDLASATGYLNSQVFALMAPMVLLIFAIGGGAGAIAGEEERGELDLLLAQPVDRAALVWQRFLALVLLIAALAVALLMTVAVGSLLVDLQIGFDKLLAASVSVALLSILFAAVALTAGAIRPGKGQAITIASGLAIAAWMLDGLAQAVSALDPWRPLSPYYHALGTNPLRDGAPWGGWALLIAMTAICLVAAAAGLRKRDIQQ